jgi:hypothetical protein
MVAGLLGLTGTLLQAQQVDSSAGRSSWAVYLGYGEGSQFLAGAQLLLKTPLQPVTLVPEVAIAHGASLLAGAGLHLSPVSGSFRPYAGISAGYLWEGDDDDAKNAFVLTPKAGLLLGAPTLGKKSLGLVLEYQGVDWFDQGRILIGARWSF